MFFAHIRRQPSTQLDAAKKEEVFMFAQTVDSNPKNGLKSKVLLIVDDCEQIGRAVKRILQSEFDKVYVTVDPAQATKILDSERVSHVLCDLNLGIDDERTDGFVFAQLWRNTYPNLEKIFIFTGENIADLTIPDFLDGIIPKSAGMEQLSTALLQSPKRGLESR